MLSVSPVAIIEAVYGSRCTDASKLKLYESESGWMIDNG